VSVLSRVGVRTCSTAAATMTVCAQTCPAYSSIYKQIVAMMNRNRSAAELAGNLTSGPWALGRAWAQFHMLDALWCEKNKLRVVNHGIHHVPLAPCPPAGPPFPSPLPPAPCPAATPPLNTSYIPLKRIFKHPVNLPLTLCFAYGGGTNMGGPY